MSHTASYAELLKMSQDDLRREINEHELGLRKMRIGVTMRREKDTAQLRRERRQLARMKTAYTRISKEALKGKPKTATIPARSSRTPRKAKASSAA